MKHSSDLIFVLVVAAIVLGYLLYMKRCYSGNAESFKGPYSKAQFAKSLAANQAQSIVNRYRALKNRSPAADLALERQIEGYKNDYSLHNADYSELDVVTSERSNQADMILAMMNEQVHHSVPEIPRVHQPKRIPIL